MPQPLISSPSHWPAWVLFSKYPKAHSSKQGRASYPPNNEEWEAKRGQTAWRELFSCCYFPKLLKFCTAFCVCVVFYIKRKWQYETFLKAEQCFASSDSPKLSLWWRVMALLTVVRMKFQRSWKPAASLRNSSLLLGGYYIFSRKKIQGFMTKWKRTRFEMHTVARYWCSRGPMGRERRNKVRREQWPTNLFLILIHLLRNGSRAEPLVLVERRKEVENWPFILS